MLPGLDDPHTLLVLTEEELVVVDLSTKGWPTHSLPYLNSVHSSPVLSTAHITAVPERFWSLITGIGAEQRTGFSKRVRFLCFG